MDSKLTIKQIRLVKLAARAAGLITEAGDGRYRLLLGQYRQGSGSPVTSCKQLTTENLEDFLAICEANGWRMPGKPEDFYRQKVAKQTDYANFSMQSAIKHLAGDLGWNDIQLSGMLKRMTNDVVDDVALLNPREAYKVIEALKAMVQRKTGKQFKNLKEIKEELSSRNSDKQYETEVMDNLSPHVSHGNKTGGIFAPKELQEATDGNTNQGT